MFSCLVIIRNVCLLTAVVDAVGNSLSAILDGEARLTFLNRGEDYVMNMPYAHCKGKSAVCFCPVKQCNRTTFSSKPLALKINLTDKHSCAWSLLFLLTKGSHGALFSHPRHPVWHHDPGTGRPDHHRVRENRLQRSA